MPLPSAELLYRLANFVLAASALGIAALIVRTIQRRASQRVEPLGVIFALVFLANAYLNLYSRLRVDITSEKKEIEVKERQAEAVQKEIEARDRQFRKMDQDDATRAANGNDGKRAS